MEGRLLLALALSLLILVLSELWLLPRQRTGQRQPASPKPRSAPLLAPTRRPFRPLRTVTVETPLWRAVWASRGGRLVSFQLKRYRDALGPEGRPVEMVSGPPPLGLWVGEQDLRELPFRLQPSGTRLLPGQQGTLVMEARAPGGLRVIKRVRFWADRYAMELSLRVVGEGAGPLWVEWPALRPPQGARPGSFCPQQVVCLNGRRREWKLKDLKATGELRGQWVGVQDKYFLVALGGRAVAARAVRDPQGVRLWVRPEGEAGLRLYLGPKELRALKGEGLQRALHFGAFDFLSRPLLAVLVALRGWVGNYGLAIVLLTVLVRLAFLPLSLKGYRSMKRLQQLQPLIQRLKERYGDDREAFNREVFRLYRSYRINPLGGCLPILVQIPVFFALYEVLLKSIELRHAPFVLWIRDLSAKDPYYVSPLLMGLSMYVQQRITPTPDPTQGRLMSLMPLIFTVMFLNFPSGLVIYWLVSNVLSIAQQLYLNRKMEVVPWSPSRSRERR